MLCFYFYSIIKFINWRLSGTKINVLLPPTNCLILHRYMNSYCGFLIEEMHQLKPVLTAIYELLASFKIAKIVQFQDLKKVLRHIN